MSAVENFVGTLACSQAILLCALLHHITASLAATNVTANATAKETTNVTANVTAKETTIVTVNVTAKETANVTANVTDKETANVTAKEPQHWKVKYCT